MKAGNLKNLLTLLVASACIMQTTRGENYYIDASSGDDEASGITIEEAWQSLSKVNAFTLQPGDHLLFKRGETWVGQLAPKGSGAEGSAIILDAYGEGELPLINGNGIADAAVLLYNLEYWEVQNLEIINPANSDSVNRIGIRVYHDTGTIANHIYLRNLKVHNVRGNNDFQVGKSSGGIQLNAGGTFLHYNDVRIEDCTVYDVSRVGITVNGAASNDTAPPTGYGTNIIMRGNHIYQTGGDGSIIRYCDYPLIEKNVVHDFPTAGGGASYTVGLWVRSTRHALMQYNEVYNSMTSNDGQAYDADIYCEDTVVQYNYSHDNKGGFMLIMGEGVRRSNRTIVRYNLSVNDSGSIFMFSLGTAPETWIYNNTFFIRSGLSTSILNRNRSDTSGSKIYFYNNIIYNLGSGGYNSFSSLISDNNCYFGNHPGSEPGEANKITADPQLLNPGSTGTGFTVLGAYQLAATSPVINRGKSLADPGTEDLFGNPLSDSRLDIGAYEFPAIPAMVDKQFSEVSSSFEITTTANRQYALERNTNLGTDGWVQVGEVVEGTGNVEALFDTNIDDLKSRFYRVRADVN